MSETKQRQIHELKMSEAEGMVTVAFAQTDATDEDEDYTFAGAFKNKVVPMSAFGHTSWPERGSALPPGIGEVKEIGGWAVWNGKCFMDTDHGRNTFHTVKGMGDAQQWSYGYDVLEFASPPVGLKAKRGLKNIDTHEVSPVLLGAQPTAHTRALKELKQLSDYIAETGASDEALADLAAETAAAQARLISGSDPELKGKPLAGETFDAHMSRVLGELRSFDERAKGLTDLRLKEGRAISSARLAQFEEHATALLAAHKTFQDIIDAARPAPKADNGAKFRRMRIEAQLGLAGLNN